MHGAHILQGDDDRQRRRRSEQENAIEIPDFGQKIEFGKSFELTLKVGGRTRIRRIHFVTRKRLLISPTRSPDDRSIDPSPDDLGLSVSVCVVQGVGSVTGNPALLPGVRLHTKDDTMEM